MSEPFCPRHGCPLEGGAARVCVACAIDEAEIDMIAERDNRPDEAHRKPVAPQRATVIRK